MKNMFCSAGLQPSIAAPSFFCLLCFNPATTSIEWKTRSLYFLTAHTSGRDPSSSRYDRFSPSSPPAHLLHPARSLAVTTASIGAASCSRFQATHLLLLLRTAPSSLSILAASSPSRRFPSLGSSRIPSRMSGGFFCGTSADQDTQFSTKQTKLLKWQKLAPKLEYLVGMMKVKMDVIRPWITTWATELVGFEDEVLIDFFYGLLDARRLMVRRFRSSSLDLWKRIQSLDAEEEKLKLRRFLLDNQVLELLGQYLRTKHFLSLFMTWA